MKPGEAIRAEFPALDQKVKGRRLAYLDSTASTQRPRSVLAAMEDFYTRDNANVHRGVHTLSQRATDRFEAARERLRAFINAGSTKEIIFTKGCTEAINLVAQSWGRANLKEGDVILLSHMEHHANIVPWQLVAEQTGAIVSPIPITDDGDVDLAAYADLLNSRVKMVGVKHVCNAIGTINPVPEMTRLAHAVGARVMVDGAQGLSHQKVDVRDLDADFYSISAHKAYGPMGFGALYGKEELLQAMPPYQAGGDMIRTVSFEKTTFNDLPNKFEPGTPYVPGAIGFAAALDFMEEVGFDAIQAHEQELAEYGREQLLSVPGVALVGNARHRTGILSFTVEGIHPHDIGTVLDEYGVAIRTGHHCCMPLMRRLGLPATARASLALYNVKDDINVMIEALHEARRIFT